MKQCHIKNKMVKLTGFTVSLRICHISALDDQTKTEPSLK